MEFTPSSAQSPVRLAICGGGAAALLILQSLKQHARQAFDVTIFEPRSRLGVGVAYSTSSPLHLLNTRACNMSVTDDPDDFVRIEIETALRRGIRVIPIFVDNASMPRREDLPPTLAPLARRNGRVITAARFGSDVLDLIRVIERLLAD